MDLIKFLESHDNALKSCNEIDKIKAHIKLL